MNQYLKDGKIYSSLLAVGENTGKNIYEFETCNLVNEFEVKCDCGRICKPGEAHSCGGYSNTGEISEWICNKCETEADRAYQASTFDVDRRESELAESEY